MEPILMELSKHIFYTQAAARLFVFDSHTDPEWTEDPLAQGWAIPVSLLAKCSQWAL